VPEPGPAGAAVLMPVIPVIPVIVAVPVVTPVLVIVAVPMVAVPVAVGVLPGAPWVVASSRARCCKSSLAGVGMP